LGSEEGASAGFALALPDSRDGCGCESGRLWRGLGNCRFGPMPTTASQPTPECVLEHCGGSHRTIGDSLDARHVDHGNAVLLPKRDSGLRDAERLGHLRGIHWGARPFEPVMERHAGSLRGRKRCGQASRKPGGATIRVDMHDLRRQRLRDLIATRFRGDRSAFLSETGLTKGRLSQLLDPKFPFGDNAARNLEERLQLPAGYFDSMDARTLQFALLFEALPPHQKERWEEIVRALAPATGPQRG
jgi:hypothetical protein